MNPTSTWRPMHRALPEHAEQMRDYQRARGITPAPVHLALVTDDEPQQFRTACGGGLGQWITGSGAQVTCPDCLEMVHA